MRLLSGSMSAMSTLIACRHSPGTVLLCHTAGNASTGSYENCDRLREKYSPGIYTERQRGA
jgi:hypothetical protein